MNRYQFFYLLSATIGGLLLSGQSRSSVDGYQILAGSTHAHTEYTWSHGEQFEKSGCSGILVFGPSPEFPGISTWAKGYVQSTTGCQGIYVIEGSQLPSPSMNVRPDWQKYQGPPSVHFALAKENGYDFYITTDHSQEIAFQPPSADNPAWVASKRQASEASSSRFVGVSGFEYSENDSPNGNGHINVINSDGLLNALVPGVDLPYFYKWLKAAKPNGDGPVVATFNHPGAKQYNNWDYRDPQVTDIITGLEVINSNNKIHYEGFINALDHGWKVSPVCGNDNHGLTGIPKNSSRTYVLATTRTKAGVLEAMKNRRTYASLARNLQCRYTVNGAIMGSTLARPAELHFDINVSSADTGNPKSKITKIDIVKDGGIIAREYTPAPDYAIRWTPVLKDSNSKFVFVRVWNAGGGDAPGADPANPVAWLAPVWTGR